jgi:hypothetical protein
MEPDAPSIDPDNDARGEVGGEEGDGTQPSGTDATPEHDPQPKPAPKPPKVTVIERFASSRGYRKDGDSRYVHRDGRSIAKSHGGRFPWEQLDASGHIRIHYLPREHCLEQEPLQLDADVWALLEQSPDIYALILESPDGKPVEATGASLSKMLSENRITLFPATYRLVFDNDNQ